MFAIISNCNRKTMEGKFTRTGRVFNLYKEQGETPRERLERLRIQRPETAHEVLSYAGRLDPMAEGVLLCLAGSANKMRDAYLDMSKEYVLDILFGFATDTYDLLGRVMHSGDPANISRARVQKALNEFRGTTSQEYPPFSSKPVEGKSLFEWARSSSLGSLILPRRTVTIHHIDIENLYQIKEPMLLSYIENAISKVQGDFRQEEILRAWHRVLLAQGTRKFPCVTVRVSCSSGTYVRSIANSVGSMLECPSLALHILRSKVGEYTAEKSLR